MTGHESEPAWEVARLLEPAVPLNLAPEPCMTRQEFLSHFEGESSGTCPTCDGEEKVRTGTIWDHGRAVPQYRACRDCAGEGTMTAYRKRNRQHRDVGP